MAKINSMISDYKFSENFTKLRNKISFNLQVTILTSGSWQIHDHKNFKKLVPPELLKAVELYEEEYSSHLSGR